MGVCRQFLTHTDPVTQRWLTATLDRVFGWPDIVRFSWSTAERLLESDAVRVQWPETVAALSAKPFKKDAGRKRPADAAHEPSEPTHPALKAFGLCEAA